MNDPFQHKVRAAAVAGWQAFAIAYGLVTLSWLLYLAVMSARPAWLLLFFGTDVSWSYVQNVWIWSLAIFKLCVVLFAFVVLWLTLWARRLGKQL